MAANSTPSPLAELATTVSTTVVDAKTLVSQQAELIRLEAGDEFRKAGDSLLKVAAGGGMTAAGAALGGLMLVHLLRRVTGLPLWVSYGVAATGLCVAGAACVRSGSRDLTRGPHFPKSAASLRENWEWLTDRRPK